MAQQIVVVVNCGILLDVYCSDPKTQIVLVDWDCEDADALHAVEFESDGRTELAYVVDVPPSAMSLLAESDTEKAIAASPQCCRLLSKQST